MVFIKVEKFDIRPSSKTSHKKHSGVRRILRLDFFMHEGYKI